MTATAQDDAAARPASAVGDAWARLSVRPRMVLMLTASGLSIKEVGRRLAISPRTAESHKYKAMLMLGLRDKAALVQFALRHGLLGAPAPPACDAAAGARAAPIDARASAFLVGTSAAMTELAEQIARFAAYDAPVLINGETGTGKATVARAIHDRSGRAALPFRAISCAACGGAARAAELAEAGQCPQAARRGPIGEARGGTLFLDEIADMPDPLQRELVQLLRDGEAGRADARGPDVRLIAATSAQPRGKLVPDRVREELYYRLDVLRLDLPPLRQRLDDVPLLADHVLRQIAAELGRDVRAFAPATVERMQSYAWPGNVRELIATVRRAVVLSDTPVVQPDALRLPTLQPGTPAAGDPAGHPAPGTAAERDLVLKTLRANDYNISRTAQALGRSRVTLYRMLARDGLAQHHEFFVRDVAGAPP
jgi:DNA-binding NtrC family response regulator/DNA-binding CsgD family transcriptional regulator